MVSFRDMVDIIFEEQQTGNVTKDLSKIIKSEPSTGYASKPLTPLDFFQLKSYLERVKQLHKSRSKWLTGKSERKFNNTLQILAAKDKQKPKQNINLNNAILNARRKILANKLAALRKQRAKLLKKKVKVKSKPRQLNLKQRILAQRKKISQNKIKSLSRYAGSYQTLIRDRPLQYTVPSIDYARSGGLLPYRSSFQTTVFPLDEDGDGGARKPKHNVTIFHKTLGTPINIGILSDTGNDVTLLREHWAPVLGYPDYKTIGSPMDVEGVGGQPGAYKRFYVVPAIMQIGSLKPMKTPIAFGDTPVDLLGRETAMKDYYVLYGPTHVAYIETNSFENALETAESYARNGNSMMANYSTSMSKKGCGCRNRM